jgi:hypothetical protein
MAQYRAMRNRFAEISGEFSSRCRCDQNAVWNGGKT